MSTINQQEQLVKFPSNDGVLVANGSTEFVIDEGFYNVNKSGVFVQVTFLGVDAQLADYSIYRRRDLQYQLQNQCQANISDEPVYQTNDLCALQFAYYHSNVKDYRKSHLLNSAVFDDYSEKTLYFLQQQTGGDFSAVSYTHKYMIPLKEFFPFLCNPQQEILEVKSSITLSISQSAVNGSLILRTNGTNVLAPHNATNYQYDIYMVKLPDYQQETSNMIYGCQQKVITSNKQEFNLKIKRGQISEYQLISLNQTSAARTILNYGQLVYAQLKADNNNQADIQKNTYKQVDLKDNKGYNTAHDEQAILDLIQQLNIKNPKLWSTYPISFQQALFRSTSINYSVYLSGQGCDIQCAFAQSIETDLVA